MFSKVLHERSAQTDNSDEMLVSIWKVLKHLNTVITLMLHPNLIMIVLSSVTLHLAVTCLWTIPCQRAEKKGQQQKIIFFHEMGKIIRQFDDFGCRLNNCLIDFHIFQYCEKCFSLNANTFSMF